MEAENIFEKYQPVDIAAMCAVVHLTRAQAKEVAGYWLLLKSAYDYYVASLQSGDDNETHIKSLEAIELVYKIHDEKIKPLPLNWPGSGNAAQGMAYAFGLMLLDALTPLDLLQTTQGADDLFLQFDDVDIAYAAALKGLDTETACKIWRDLPTHFGCEFDSPPDAWTPVRNQEFHETLTRFDRLFSRNYSSNLAFEAFDVAEDMLRYLDLIA